MQAVRKCHILSSLFLLLISSGQCMDSKEVRQKERRILLDHILQVNGDSQWGDKPSVSSRYNSGLFPAAQDMNFSSGEKPLYVPRLDNSRPIGKLIRFIFRPWWNCNPYFTGVWQLPLVCINMSATAAFCSWLFVHFHVGNVTLYDLKRWELSINYDYFTNNTFFTNAIDASMLYYLGMWQYQQLIQQTLQYN